MLRTALGLVLVLGGAALAETPKTAPPKVERTYTPKPPPPPHKEGEYSGTTNGVKPADKSGKPTKKPAKGTLSWIGFEAKDGGAQLFFQSLAPFEITQEVSGGAVYVHLALNQLGANTWRQVDTRYFDNPLSMVQAKKVGATKTHKAGIEVKVTFKNPRDAKEGAVKTETGPDGLAYVYLTFPEGTEARKDK